MDLSRHSGCSAVSGCTADVARTELDLLDK